MTEITMHRTRISGQDWSALKPGPAPTVSAPYEVQETTFVPVGEVESAKDYLRNLLISFVHEHCDPVPEWAPLPDLMGMLTQIDNAITVTRDLREALTPSSDTKAAYVGEFSVSFPDFDENGIEYTRAINVPWTAIKEIMAAILAKAEGQP